MSKKYLSLEEAADQLGLSNDELIRLRERGEIRGFADRGTWKFKADDVQEYRRSSQADSDPEVPLYREDSSVLASDSVVRPGSGGSSKTNSPSDSDVRLVLDDSFEDDDDNDPEVSLGALLDSDSDVSLSDGTEPLVDMGSDSDVKLIGGDSDSDVRMAGKGGSGIIDSGSDSDVKLVGADSDSDVRMAAPPDSDSDIELLGADSDSDIELIGADSDSDISLVTSDSDVRVISEDSKKNFGSDSDVRLVLDDLEEHAAESDSVFSDDDSGIALEGMDSGIALDACGSGIALDSGDTGIGLERADDSGISLGASDSGIALEALADSGISLGEEDDDFASDSGIALVGGGSRDDDMGGTVPMLDAIDEEEEGADTMMEVPALDDDSGYSLAGGATEELMFDEDEAEPVAPRGRAKPPSRTEEIETDDTFDLDDKTFGEVEEFDEDMEVAEDITGGDDESVEELDVFGAEDEDFEDSFISGESHADFVAPSSTSRQVAAPVEADWGGGTFAGLIASTVLMALCALLMFDLVRSMWLWREPYGINSSLLDIFSKVL